MPLPDAKPDRRIYELLKTTDLESLTFSDFQKVAQTIYAEQGAEDELRRIVLVNLARLAGAGEWTGLTSSGGGGGIPVLNQATSLNSSQKTHFISGFPPYPSSILSTSNQNITTKVIFFPFVLPKDLTFASLTINVVGGTTGDDLDAAIYNSDTSTGVPTTKVSGSDVTFATGSTTGVIANFSSNVSLTGGTVYWLGIVKNAGTITIRSHGSADGYPQAPITDMSSFNVALIQEASGSGALASTITASDYETVYGLRPLIGAVEA